MGHQVKLDFHPARHGYHFANTFTNHVFPGITTKGLCGGMAMSALDYWRANISIPTHFPTDFSTKDGVPEEGSRLQSYIYTRQVHSMTTGAIFINWVTTMNPQEFHQAAIGKEFQHVVGQINKGRPALLGLWALLPGDVLGGHQVLCYGFEENPIKLFIYDPNFPDQEIVLIPDSPQTGVLVQDIDGKLQPVQATNGQIVNAYRGYFFTDVYNWGENPPYQPPYYDLHLEAGLNLSPGGEKAIVRKPVNCFAIVKNAGDYRANFDGLSIFAQSQDGGKQTTFPLNPTEHFVPGLDPGEEVHLSRSSVPELTQAPTTLKITAKYKALHNAVSKDPVTGSHKSEQVFLPIYASASGTKNPVQVTINSRYVATVMWPNKKAYFFRDNIYIRYDAVADSADPGYPEQIYKHWTGI